MAAHPRSITDGRYFSFEFRLDRIYNFGDSVISIFLHFGLKLHIHAHLEGFGGHYFPQTTSSIVLTPKRHFLMQKHVV